MSFKKKVKLLILNSIIVIVNVILFSKPFLGFSLLKGSYITIAISWLDLFISSLIFVKGNLYILRKSEIHILAKEVKNLNDCISIFQEAIYNGDVFDDNIIKNIEQIKRFSRKYNTINDMLLQKFSEDEITYKKFNDVLNGVQNVIYINMKSILNKISAFDEDEYINIINNKEKQQTISQEKLEIYNKYIDFVNESTNINEEILLKLDKMILEISKYNTIDGGDIKKMPVIMEMDELIKNAKLYK